jgi:hypothetical protein
MAEKYVGQILISRRTVRIGHQVYPLANISRVQTLLVAWCRAPSESMTTRRGRTACLRDISAGS